MDHKRPPVLAWVNQACYSCFTEEDLKRCGGCKRVSFCSNECSRANWSKHKSLCKALKTYEQEPAAILFSSFSLSEEPSDHDGYLFNAGEADGKNKLRRLADLMKRPLTVDERNLVGWEPRCLGCTRTDQLLRMEKKTAQLQLCPECKLSFFCSGSHRDFAMPNHKKVGPEGVSQCGANQMIREDDHFKRSAGPDAPDFAWAPSRVVSEWTSLGDSSWTTEYTPILAEEAGLPESALPGILRVATEGLTMPLTILLALEKLARTPEWFKQETLVIHVIGASQHEMMRGMMFEEILHRVPEVKVLKIYFVGPQLSQFGGSGEIDMDCCPKCTAQGRKRTHVIQAMSYHEFASKPSYTKPDVAVAQNSGCGSEETASWKPTIKLLVDEKIPALFTSYQQEEAEQDHDLIKSLGATIDPSLAKVYNKWASHVRHMEPFKVKGYYTFNGWLAAGFR
ncbi:hypothetical protein BOTBODRAFT_135118 [Botryobasidium botryosum FD-172 SS1]|uniref:MYND-type domain-containing protein n=1 Tax=Botryobasidium botryosum (strain FD-172 SS1) TaxID=930990 RepID=A0A067M8U1_BOTB1|nr:hypothetical protein BOTBODRAFT_135118 [Botryobasidium botryosum FD-172 SS1]